MRNKEKKRAAAEYAAAGRVKQESLANAKVNARQHCVSLSCLGDEDLENIASERYINT